MDRRYKIAIIGGTGRVGRYVAAHAVREGYQVRMLVRDRNRLTYHDEQIKVIEGQVQELNTLRTLLEGCDIVINTFGQPAKEDPIYSKVTADIFRVMNELNISRYIGVSGASLTINGDKKNVINRIGASLFKLFFPKLITDKLLEWDIMLANKQIDWTLIRLPFVKDSLQSKRIKESLIDMPGTKITNQDIAAFIVSQINARTYVHRAPFISH